MQGPESSGIKKLNIPERILSDGEFYTVTSIASNAFLGCSQLTSVTMGSGIETIGTSAFSGTGVKTVTFSRNLKIIGKKPFTILILKIFRCLKILI